MDTHTCEGIPERPLLRQLTLDGRTEWICNICGFTWEQTPKEER